ncbi:hypothetical protein R1flu_003554 [Riccia fluitans]|uniref:Uncharacterized protein n=1 Tax=Riccia fluitans TaxID=41844 RepID=A0ABD1YAB0_9MARC
MILWGVTTRKGAPSWVKDAEEFLEEARSIKENQQWRTRMVESILRKLQANDRDDAMSTRREAGEYSQSNDHGSNWRYTVGTDYSSSSWNSGCSSSRSNRLDGEGLMAEVESRRR